MRHWRSSWSISKSWTAPALKLEVLCSFGHGPTRPLFSNNSVICHWWPTLLQDGHQWSQPTHDNLGPVLWPGGLRQKYARMGTSNFRRRSCSLSIATCGRAASCDFGNASSWRLRTWHEPRKGWTLLLYPMDGRLPSKNCSFNDSLPVGHGRRCWLNRVLGFFL